MPDAPPPLPKSQPSFSRRNSTMLKLLGVGALILLMLIPLLMIEGVLNDRLGRRNEAVTDITASWGKESRDKIVFGRSGGDDNASNRQTRESGMIGIGIANRVFVGCQHEIVHAVQANPFKRDAKGIR